MGLRIAIIVSLALVLLTPLVLAPAREQAPDGARRLVIITPHNEQLRYEFGRGFSDWHQRVHGEPVAIDWRRPGGTSEIRRQLQAEYSAAIKSGAISPEGDAPPGTMGYDLLFGGGSYEHGQMKSGVRVGVGEGDEARTVNVSISVPVDFSDERLEDWYGENRIGSGPLWDPDRHWFGYAVSSFGVVYNRDVLKRLGLPEPQAWADLTDPRYAGWIALADPRQSGSVATTYESILNKYGWDEGWRILRAMAANAHTFSNGSTKVVLDVSRGEAALALAIDFYGRYESQALLEPGQDPSESRVGYVDPAGAVYLDPDPISMLRGAPHPELARRFIEYLMTDEGQALWQLAAVGEEGREAGELGPVRFELRRLPIRREFIAERFDEFIDRVDPFEIASELPSRGWRSMISPLFAAFAIENRSEQKQAWKAIQRVRAAGASEAEVAALEDLFFAFPEHTLMGDVQSRDGSVTPAGTTLPLNAENYGVIREDWRDPRHAAELRLVYNRFFLEQYQRVIERAEELLRA